MPDFASAPLTHFVSLIDPEDGQRPVSPPSRARHHAQLLFHDVDDVEAGLPDFSRYKPPTDADIRILVDFGRAIAPLEDWGLLVQGEAGVSRCSAAAMIILVAIGYPPPTAFRVARQACREMLPNRRMLRLADEILGTGGLLEKMGTIYRRKAFERAGYDDPTEELASGYIRSGRGFRKALGQIPRRWKSLVDRVGQPKRRASDRAAALSDILASPSRPQIDARIKVSLLHGIVYVLDGDQPIMMATATVGNPDHPAPTGHFRVLSKIEHYCSNTFGFWINGDSVVSGNSMQCPGPGYRYNEFPLDYYVSFYPGYGFHVGAAWDTSIPHGCLRLHEKAARELYALARVGTPVCVAETQAEDLTIARHHPKNLDFCGSETGGASMASPVILGGWRRTDQRA